MMVIFRSIKRTPAFTVPEGMEVKLHAQEWWTPEHYSSTEIRVRSMTTRVLFDVPVLAFNANMERVQ
jgi:hypothetical protein